MSDEVRQVLKHGVKCGQQVAEVQHSSNRSQVPTSARTVLHAAEDQGARFAGRDDCCGRVLCFVGAVCRVSCSYVNVGKLREPPGEFERSLIERRTVGYDVTWTHHPPP